MAEATTRKKLDLRTHLPVKEFLQKPLPVLHKVLSCFDRVCKSCILPIQRLIEQKMRICKDAGIEQSGPVSAEKMPIITKQCRQRQKGISRLQVQLVFSNV